MKGPNLAEWLILAAMAAVLALAFASISTQAIRGVRLQEFGSLMAQLTNGLPNISDLQTDAKEPFAVEHLVERASHEETYDIGDRSTPNVYSPSMQSAVSKQRITTWTQRLLLGGSMAQTMTFSR